MNKDWENFLTQQNDLITEPEIIISRDDQPCLKMDLSYLGIIRIRGEDKQTFLQGQLTSDTRLISATMSQLSSYCTPKGRVLASFRLIESGDDWLIILPRVRLEAILKRLQMFVLRAKVTIEDASDQLICIGLIGECFKTDAVTESHQVFQMADVTTVLVDPSAPRYLAVGSLEAIKTLWTQYSNVSACHSNQWRLSDIQSGIPSIVDQTSEAFIPQMINLQALEGVSFTKGCYTGQEIVARMQYLGKLKRRMYLIHFDSELTPQPGDTIYSASSQSGQGAGKLVDVIEVTKNHFQALSVLEINSIKEGPLQLYDDQGPIIHLDQLPYSIDAEEK